MTPIDIFKISENCINTIPDILLQKNLCERNILVISGKTFSKKIADKISHKSIVQRISVESDTITESLQIAETLQKSNINLIIGVGGGKVLDITKRISLIQNIEHISIPTTISNDGLISPISVLKQENGRTISMPGKAPLGVIIDISIFKNLDFKYIQSAAGDILSNLSTTNDWLISSKKHNEDIYDMAYQLSRSSAENMIYFNPKYIEKEEFIRVVISGQISSGFAMGIAGSSRPCSGSEHLLSHAMDYLNIESKSLHGYKVGVLSLFCLYLQKELNQTILEYAKRIQLPFVLSSWRNLTEKELTELFKISRKMRPGRKTILDKFNDKELLSEFHRYDRMIKKTTDYDTTL